ncbi:hypothetical protein EB001_01450 [bacterium]|jgi:hypothetical protein|nr:hypothetical protein [bacterium]
MSNNYWDDEDEDQDNDTNLTGDDLVKKLRKAKRADEKRIKELVDQLESLTKANRERIVYEVLEKKGINAKAARLILKDLDEVSEESLNGWLSENGDLIGYQSEVQNEQEKQNLAALRQQDVITHNGIMPDRTDELSMKLDNAQSADELLAFLRSQS